MKPPFEIKEIKDFAYITSRKLPNEQGEKSGEVFMWRRKGEEEFNYKLKCPYCGEEQESSVVFNKRPYRVKCSNCGKSIMVEKLSKK
jgi:ribosomal protein S27E